MSYKAIIANCYQFTDKSMRLDFTVISNNDIFLDLYERGVADAADIDRAVRASIGFRLASIGPLLTMDLGGIKLWLAVYKNLINDLHNMVFDTPATYQILIEVDDEPILVSSLTVSE